MSQICQVTGKKPMSGNNVSHAQNKTRRRFVPNLHWHRFWVGSENRYVRLRVSAKGMRIIDRRGIDDPVGMYLPEFPLTGPNAVTLRHCFTHTSGFYGHALFDGVHNPWLENTLAQVIKNETVGTKHKYNGMGYDLAGKVMEVVTGKSVFRLFREYLYDPLEMKNTVHDWDLGFSCQSTAFDLAKVGQMLLNGGSYGNLQFFSRETHEKILPKELKDFYPGVNKRWGSGINYQDFNKQISDNVIGHGSATSNTFWVAPDHDLVITQTRRRGSRNFGPNFRNVIAVIKKHLITEKRSSAE